MNPLKSHLRLQSLNLDVNLGWPEQERLQKQTVKVDITVCYLEPPLACITDELDDTFCYAELIQTIQNHVASASFRLLEHLAQSIYRVLKSTLPSHLKIKIEITKWPPSISNLIDGACFSYGDFE